MKRSLLLLGLSLSLTTLAGTITKTDTGSVTWMVKVNKKQEGSMIYSRTSSGLNGSNDVSIEELRILTQMSFNTGVGGLNEVAMVFSSTDERSQESVEEKLKVAFTADIKDYPLKPIETEVKLKNVSCKESGFLKKRLNCSADFEHVQVLEVIL